MDKNENVNVRCDHFSLKWHRETKRKIFAEFARFFLTKSDRKGEKNSNFRKFSEEEKQTKKNKSCDLRTLSYSTFVFFVRCFIQKVNISYLIDDQKQK